MPLEQNLELKHKDVLPTVGREGWGSATDRQVFKIQQKVVNVSYHHFIKFIIITAKRNSYGTGR